MRDFDRYFKKAEKATYTKISLGSRYAKYTRELAKKEENPIRKAELLQIAANYDVVPAHKPQTYWQAIQWRRWSK